MSAYSASYTPEFAAMLARLGVRALRQVQALGTKTSRPITNLMRLAEGASVPESWSAMSTVSKPETSATISATDVGQDHSRSVFFALDEAVDYLAVESRLPDAPWREVVQEELVQLDRRVEKAMIEERAKVSDELIAEVDDQELDKEVGETFTLGKR